MTPAEWPARVPEGLNVRFASMDDTFMQKAFLYAYKNTFGTMTTTSSVVVLHDEIIGRGINGDGFHVREQKCLRIGGTVGQDYESCPGCHPDNHSERVALREAQVTRTSLKNAELYLYGHWWSCEPCMRAILNADIKTIYILENSRPLFDRSLDGQKEKRKEFEEKWYAILTP